MPSGIEIERKFLVAALPPGAEGDESQRIDQGYPALGDDYVEVRVRRRGESLHADGQVWPRHGSH